MKLGDIVQLGRHRLMCGDATLREDVYALVGGDRVNMVLTDPPYSSGGQYKGDRTYAPEQKYQQGNTQKFYPTFTHDNMDAHSWVMFNHLWHSNIYPYVSEGGYVMQFTDWRQLPTTTDVLQTVGYIWRGIVVWDKTQACRPQKGMFRAQCEYVPYATKGKITSEAVLPGVYTQYLRPYEKLHMTAKPVKLCELLMKIIPDGGTVYDPFGGSGTTLIACEMTGRTCLMMELSPEYCEIICERYEKLKAEYPLLASASWES